MRRITVSLLLRRRKVVDLKTVIPSRHAYVLYCVELKCIDLWCGVVLFSVVQCSELCWSVLCCSSLYFAVVHCVI